MSTPAEQLMQFLGGAVPADVAMQGPTNFVGEGGAAGPAIYAGPPAAAAPQGVQLGTPPIQDDPTLSKWQNFAHHIRNSPGFGDALITLGANLMAGGNPIQNLSKGLLGGIDVMNKARQENEARKAREAALNLEGRKVTNEEARTGIDQQRANTEDKNVASEIQTRAKNLDISQEQLDLSKDKLATDKKQFAMTYGLDAAKVGIADRQAKTEEGLTRSRIALIDQQAQELKDATIADKIKNPVMAWISGRASQLKDQGMKDGDALVQASNEAATNKDLQMFTQKVKTTPPDVLEKLVVAAAPNLLPNQDAHTYFSNLVQGANSALAEAGVRQSTAGAATPAVDPKNDPLVGKSVGGGKYKIIESLGNGRYKLKNNSTGETIEEALK